MQQKLWMESKSNLSEMFPHTLPQTKVDVEMYILPTVILWSDKVIAGGEDRAEGWMELAG